MRHLILCVLFSVAIICQQGLAQGPPAPSGAEAVTFDYQKFSLKGDFPFDQSFYLRIDKVPKNADSVRFLIHEGRNRKIPYTFISSATRFHDSFFLPFVSSRFGHRLLLPGRDYTARIEFFDATGNPLPDAPPLEFGFTTETRFANYTAADFGFAYVPDLKAGAAFTTVHVYLTALNENTDLMEIKGFSRNVFLRTSFFIGASPFMLQSDNAESVTKLFSIGNFVYGIGIRSPFYGPWLPWFRNKAGRIFLQPLRVNLGKIIFLKADENQVLKHHSSPYIGLSYALNISSLFKPVSKLASP